MGQAHLLPVRGPWHLLAPHPTPPSLPSAFLISPPFPYFPSPFVTSLPLPSAPRPALRSRLPEIQLGGLGKRCKFLEWGNRIWCISALTSDVGAGGNNFNDFPEIQLTKFLRNNAISCRVHDFIFCNNQLPERGAPECHPLWCKPEMQARMSDCYFCSRFLGQLAPFPGSSQDRLAPKRST